MKTVVPERMEIVQICGMWRVRAYVNEETFLSPPFLAKADAHNFMEKTQREGMRLPA